MATMNISLPDDMKDFIEAEVKAKGFMSASEYVRDLIRYQKDVAKLRGLIQEGIDSGPPIPLDEVMAELRAMIEQE